MIDPLSRLRAELADRYSVERELGAGGMATVYLARDLRHDRQVALKVLRPELTAILGPERFLREVRVTANLQHPNVLPLYDSGTAGDLLYYVMPYVAGESLRDRLQREAQLPIDDAIAITCAVARALDYAHRHGVVHRDIKPENILLQDGQPLVADFGVSLAIRHAGGTRLTETGLSVGTPQYMSPEQASGERELDARSDVFSLGCVLFEMLAGTPPHTGPTARAVIARTVTEPPPPLGPLRDSVPHELEKVVRRALAKAPADRYATSQEFAQALGRATGQVPNAGRREALWRRPIVLGAAAAIAIVLLAIALLLRNGSARSAGAGGDFRVERLAVLPLENLIGDTMAFFVDGMHDAMIGELARLDGLEVISRTSVRSYRNSDKTASQIAAELGVDAVVEGSVFSDGRTVRVQAQLIGVRPERHLWAESYDRQLGDALALHRDVARSVAGAIQLTLTPRDQIRLATSARVDPEALNDYLRGRHHFNQFAGPEQDSLAIHYFERALARDPGFAMAYAGLADALAARGEPRRESMERARGLALRALELDSTLAEAHSALGGVKHWHDWDWDGARIEFERAIRLNPSYAQAHQWHAELLATLGMLDSAVAEVKRAGALDPLSPVIVWNTGRILWFARRLDEAAAQYERVLEFDPYHPMGHEGLMFIRLHEGREAEAYRHLRSLLQGLRADPALLVAMDSAYGAGGLPGVHARLDREPREIGRRSFVELVRGGHHEMALDEIERRHRQREFGKDIPALVNDAWLDPVRGHPRFRAVLRAMGLDRGSR
jgi:eukaryotic-like serine/threonine-protein kinase